MSDESVSPSTSERPDLDWSQVRETVRMFRIGVSSIEYSMSTGDDSISSLIETFTKMNRYMREIKNLVGDVEEKIPESCRDSCKVLRQAVDKNSDQVIADLKSAVICFQFYDRLTQQLSHIAHSLENTADLVGDQTRLYNPTEWKKLQQEVHGSFTMEEGKVLFDALLRGATKEEAIEEAKAFGNKDADSLELF